ncbi:MAG: hypothetical protein AAGI69_24395 [Cyanobacteria bacterium P01_H01_bin.21]
MGHSNEQPEEEQSPLSKNQLALRDATLVADDLLLDTKKLPRQYYLSTTTKTKPKAYTVELFWDEVLITATELFYGEAVYRLDDIDSLQILKLHRRRTIIQKKITNFLAGIVATIGLLLIITPVLWLLIRGLGGILLVGSLGYAVYFNWWLEQRRRGEFGLLMTMKVDSKVVITSHSLAAIQTLYQIMFRRLDRGNPAAESLMVNMYTGEIIQTC